jgi:glycosyltransferase involved in cell wall biosynthesis
MGSKICMFVYNTCSHDSRVLKEAKTLASSGHDVKIIAFIDENTSAIEERDGFRILRIKRNPLHYRIMTKLSPILDLLRKLPVQVKNPSSLFKKSNRGLKKHNHKQYLTIKEPEKSPNLVIEERKSPLKIRTRIRKRLTRIFHKPLVYLDFANQCLSLLKDEPADIYHAHDLNTLMAGWRAKRKYGGNLVYDSHELYVERNALRNSPRITKVLLRKMEGFFLKSTDRIITVCDSIANEFSKRYSYPFDHIKVIMNAPAFQEDVKPFSLRKKLDIPENKKILLYIGRITVNRGLEQIIQSMNSLDEFVFVIMGYGAKVYIKQLKSYIEKEGFTDRVFFFGPVPHEEVVNYAASADLGIAAIQNVCLSYYFCAPNKIFDYISAGIPVVGSNFPEIDKICNSYKIGLTFDPKDPENIAQAVNCIVSDPVRYHQMKENALKASLIFNWENEEKKLNSLYAELN